MASATTGTPIVQNNSDDLSSVFTEEVSRSILDFWFADSSLYPTQEQVGRWFRPSSEFDEQCRSKFASIISKIAVHPLSSITSLATSPERTLSLLILLDQIPRNIFRGDLSAKAYTETDPLATAISLHSLSPSVRYDLGPESAWKTVPARRMWFYLPLMHSEDLALHKLALDTSGTLEDYLEEEAKEGESMGLMMAKVLRGHMEEHTAVVKRFGRYPHRNKVLGRESTPEERTWLENPGVGWAK